MHHVLHKMLDSEVTKVHSLKCGGCRIPVPHFEMRENFGKVKTTRVHVFVKSNC